MKSGWIKASIKSYFAGPLHLVMCWLVMCWPDRASASTLKQYLLKVRRLPRNCAINDSIQGFKLCSFVFTSNTASRVNN